MDKKKYQSLNLSPFKKIKPKRYNRILIEDKFPLENIPNISPYSSDRIESIKDAQRSYSFLKNNYSKSYRAPKTQRYVETSQSFINESRRKNVNHDYHSKQKFMVNSVKTPYYREKVDLKMYENIRLKNKRNQQPKYNFYQLRNKQSNKVQKVVSCNSNSRYNKNCLKVNQNLVQQLRETQDTMAELQNISHRYFPKIQDFLLVLLLGKGKNGQVYLAIHKSTGFACAIKIIKKKDINKYGPIERQKIYEQILRQIKIQMYLSHPNLIQLYCVFANKQHIYLIQQLGIAGQLYQLMKKRQKFSQQATALIARDILNGIKGMHDKKIIHRDLKPQNIVLVYGTCKICDFGWSIYCPNQMRKTLCGTLLYLSPQLLVGQEYNYKIDIWSYGTLIYQLFAGQDPFKVKNKSDLKKVVIDQLKFGDNFSQKLKRFISFILKKNHTERPNAAQIQKHQFLRKYAQLQTSQQLSYY